MKKGYVRLFIFELLLILFLILNSFVWNILTNYGMLIFLLVTIVIFNIFFGLEKDRHRYIKDIVIDVLIFLFIFFMLYYLFGIIVGFARTGNYYNLNGLINFIIPGILLIFLKEYLRYEIMVKTEENKILPFVTCILFILLDLTNAFYYSNFTSSYDVFIFIALSLLPSISSNIVFSYLTLKTGYKPIVVYLLFITMYQYLLPIVPNPSEYLVSIINFLLPIIMWYRIYLFFEKESDKEVESRIKSKNNILSLGISVVIVVVLVYFSSGYFHYQAVAVASGSMVPEIHKGDVVIIEKIDNDFSSLQEGQVIAFKYNSVIVVHRLIDIKKTEDKYYFYSKGDANEKPDNFVIDENMIIGTVNVKIPYVGLPTVWLNEL